MRTRLPRLRPVHPGFVVFGIDHRDHTRAAWFSPHEHHLARMASNMTGFQLLKPPRQGPASLPDWLPRGTRLESGRFVVPRVRRGLFQKLCDLDEIASRTQRSTGPDEDLNGHEPEGSPLSEEDLLEALSDVMNGLSRDKSDND